MTTSLNKEWKIFLEGSANSYSMVFFSIDRWFALLVLVLTFADPVAGVAGLITVLLVNSLALLLGLDQGVIQRGEFGFNALLVGLGLGAFYELNLALLLMLFFAVVITLFITIVLMGILTKYGLPFLSIPFVLGLWTVLLASRNFEALGLSQRGLYLLNELYAVGENYLVHTYHFLNDLQIPVVIKTYFRSLGAILFQYNMLSGMVLALALLFYSRIAFTLSLLGFFTAYFFYQLIGADLTQLNYTFIGFNFILSAVAVGGFYLVPSRWSFLWVIILTPVLAILTTSLTNLLAPFQLGTYSLPFNMVVISFLYVLKWRYPPVKPEEVSVQNFSPEKNKYHYLSNVERFKNYRSIPVSLPVMGNWLVSQGHEGAYTHRAEWKHAWDFVVIDDDELEYQGKGNLPEDYYCYGKPVIAPADGKVVDILDGIEDNSIGTMNLIHNWGNTILIDHGLSLYSQLSHLKPGSLKVGKGDWIKKGQILGLCGNSGRSPYPHVHFQLQATPYIGAPTLEYPISSFLSKRRNEGFQFHFFDYPEAGAVVHNIEPEELLKAAYYFIPGKKFHFLVDGNERVEWECKTDFYNNSYLECSRSGARAYFQNNGVLHYFTDYQGKKETLLYHFFLANYKVALSFEQGLLIKDSVPLDILKNRKYKWWQDLAAPFYQYQEATFQLEYQKARGLIQLEEITLASTVRLKNFGQEQVILRYAITIKDYGIQVFEIQTTGKTIRVERITEQEQLSPQNQML